MESDYVKVGQLGKSFGVEGYCRIKLYEDFQSVSANSEFFFINHDNYYVPYRVDSHDRNNKMIRFADIINQHKADQLQSLSLYLPYKDVESLLLSEQHPLIGFFIMSNNTSIGKIIDIREMPHQLLATVAHLEKELFIPIHEDLIIELDQNDKMLIMDLPDGILDL